MFRNVLLPLDAGFIPRTALRTAVTAGGGDVEITLLHVIDVGRDVAGSSYYSVLTDNDVPLFASHICRSLGDSLAIVSECGAKASTLVVLGGPLHMVIKDVARDLQADVIIMGRRGHRGLSRFLWGSLTETIIKEAEIPVLVVSEFVKPTHPREAEARRSARPGEITL
jgi:nucleotide-binding universal stress UspA family protein